MLLRDIARSVGVLLSSLAMPPSPAMLLARAAIVMFITAAFADLLDVACHLVVVLGLLQKHFAVHTGVGHGVLHSVEAVAIWVAVAATLSAVVGEVLHQVSGRRFSPGPASPQSRRSP